VKTYLFLHSKGSLTRIIAFIEAEKTESAFRAARRPFEPDPDHAGEGMD